MRVATVSFLVGCFTLLTTWALYDYFAHDRGLPWQYGLSAIIWSWTALAFAASDRYRELKARGQS